MYLINKTENRIEKIFEKSFTDLGFKERENLQEWIANNPNSLGEDLLIIQKEFSGFDDTRERLDLLAIDKQGNLVIIENKLDDTGRDVTWQILKYASYCSSLSKSQIIGIYQAYLDKYYPSFKAEENISEFYDGIDIEEISLNKGQTQRLMLIAGNFRKEVTSTVIWLLNYNLRIQCFKVTPFQLNEQLFLNIEQIIPMKEAEDYSVKMAEKTQDDISSQEELKTRHVVRREFWTKLLKVMNEKSHLFQNISPTIYNWLGAGSGIRGVGFNLCVSKKSNRAEIYIDRGDQSENKLIFDFLFAMKDDIEEKFGKELIWERFDDKRASVIKYISYNYNVFEKECWEELIEFLTDGMIDLSTAFKDPLKKIGNKLKNKSL